MKIYLLKRTDKHDQLDVYYSAVVCAKSAQDAKTIHPGGGDLDSDCESWVNSVHDVYAIYIGKAAPQQKRGVVLSHFRPG